MPGPGFEDSIDDKAPERAGNAAAGFTPPAPAPLSQELWCAWAIPEPPQTDL